MAGFALRSRTVQLTGIKYLQALDSLSETWWHCFGYSCELDSPVSFGFEQNRNLPVVVKNLVVARTLLFSAVGPMVLLVLVLVVVVEVVVLVVLVVPNSLSWMRDILGGRA